MMETFIVLGLCFILYEALDFFQGCMHSTSPNSTDQIEAYRRQLDEQRQQQQQEQFIANLTPLLGAQLLAATSNISLSPSESSASIISEQLRAQQQREQLEQLRSSSSVRSERSNSDNSASTPALHSSGLGSTFGSAAGSGSLSAASASVGSVGSSGGAAFRPAYRSVYESQELYATSSLPRDYYFLQQQQQKNKHSARSLFSKFGASNSDNRIFPETASVLGVPAGVITQQPVASVNHFDCLPPTATPASPLAVDLKRAILSKNNYNSKNKNNKNATNNEKKRTGGVESVQVHGLAVIASPSRDPPNPARAIEREKPRNRIASAANVTASALRRHESDASSSDCESDSSGESSDSSASASAGSASLASCGEDSDPGLGEEREFGLSNSGSSSHADFREIECERLRRKCVSVKRIYSISEKF
ncbi:PREDICTED: uncharacterized protein LOC108364878 [Rhagoletis zephyria]|uniref:uncharacterized protein LOC108364878 n=1 Tax=Rhagoletis zephyria TaxID=28612 RepID=UPI000811204F|nr:PREDICTED: uncharacterized protein LOC108364878 [Rhagoletis zephyria]XP_017474233.1 PREDICTED: uncharacterized protein LOC108364878 [Rhagoletis zephyria]